MGKGTLKLAPFILVLGAALISSCAAQVDIGFTGQSEGDDASGTLGLDLQLASPDSPEQGQGQAGNSQGNEQISLRSEGLLIILGIGLLILVSLGLGVLRSKNPPS